MIRVVSFAGLELDERSRCLRHGDREIVLQPRVFGLLAYLVRHRDRVVSLEELIDGVWEGAFVADGAVQRAVSLARAALRETAPEAIRTYPRQGYRFCAEVEEAGDEPGRGQAGQELAAPREAFAREAWEEADRAYRAADSDEGLPAADLERWGQALEYQGRPQDAVIPLERAVAGHASVGDRRGAARAALRLASIQLERREQSVARGWHRRAARHLEGEDTCREHGLFEWLSSRFALFSRDLETAAAHARRAAEIGRRLEDGDLEALGLLYTGLTALGLGDTERGLACLDEAGTAVLGGEVGPWEGGVVFCGIIWSCVNRGDWRRAGEWTDQFSRWCSGNSVSGYPGLCRLHRAEVLSLQGALSAAEREVREARQMLAESAPWAEGDAHRLLGEILLARGELDAAEECFRRAHALGWDPNPGLALLQVARGRPEAALRSLEAAVADGGWVNAQKRALLLAHLVMVAAAAGKTERAREALAQLDARPDAWTTPGGTALVSRARGELALEQGRPAEAVAAFREAIRAWAEASSPCNVAGVRLRLGEALAAGGDLDGAELEVASAESVFAEVDLPLLVAECQARRAALRGE